MVKIDLDELNPLLTNKEKKKKRLRKNIERGRAGEELYKFSREFFGDKYERTGKGSDFVEKRGKKEVYIEVKTGKSKLSKLQKKTKKEKKNYEEIRYRDPYDPDF